MLDVPTPVTPGNTEPRGPHPFTYLLLIIPFGAVSGFTTVALAFLATRQGLTEADGADIVAFSMAPQVVKFLWAPIADMTLDRKRWYAISLFGSIAALLALSAIRLDPTTIGLVKGIALFGSIATSFLGMSVEGMIAALTPEDQRGRVGGWLQAGNLGGSGIGGGMGLWLMTRLAAPWLAGVVISLCFLVFSSALFWIPHVPADTHGDGVRAAIRDLLRSLWSLANSRAGLFAALLCFVPISTGAASGVLAQASVAARWGAGEDEVALVNGLLAGFIMAFGSFVGGQACARMKPRTVYALVGAGMGLVALGMAFAPMTRTVFIVGGMSYAFGTGMAYASWTGFVLQTIGRGAAATKYNLYASLSNTPITYMGLILGHTVATLGPSGMLIAEALAGFLGIAVVLVGARLILGKDEAVAVPS